MLFKAIVHLTYLIYLVNLNEVRNQQFAVTAKNTEQAELRVFKIVGQSRRWAIGTEGEKVIKCSGYLTAITVGYEWRFLLFKVLQIASKCIFQQFLITNFFYVRD